MNKLHIISAILFLALAMGCGPGGGDPTPTPTPTIDPGICPTEMVSAIDDSISNLEIISTYTGATMASCEADVCPLYYLCGSSVSYDYPDLNAPHHLLNTNAGFAYAPGATEGYFVGSRTIDIDDNDADVSSLITWADDTDIAYDLDEELACHTYFKAAVEASSLPCDLTP